MRNRRSILLVLLCFALVPAVSPVARAAGSAAPAKVAEANAACIQAALAARAQSWTCQVPWRS